MFAGKEVIKKSVNTKKNEFGNINEVCVEEVYSNEEVDYESVFHYLIKDIATKLINLADHDIYSKISIKHGNPIDYKHFHEKTMKLDFCLKLIGKDLKDFEDNKLTKEEKEKLLKIFKNVICITEEEFNNNTKKDS